MDPDWCASSDLIISLSTLNCPDSPCSERICVGPGSRHDSPVAKLPPTLLLKQTSFLHILHQLP